MSEPGSEPRSQTRIQSVTRAMALLVAVAESEDGVTAKQLSERFDLSLPTTYHLLTTLQASGMLTKDDAKSFRLGEQAGVVARAYDRMSSVPAIHRAALREVVDLTGETGYLSAWHGLSVRVLDTVEGSRSVRVTALWAGFSDALHARASGKLLLALADPEHRRAALAGRSLEAHTPHTITDAAALGEELERIRAEGLAFDRQEFELGIDCVAVPLVASGRARACLTVSVPSQRFDERRDDVIAALRAVARRAEA